MAKLSNAKKAAAKKTTESGSAAKKAATKKTVELDNEDGIEDSEEEVDQEANGNSAGAETKSTLLNECKKLFQTTDLYKVFELEKSTATANDSKNKEMDTTLNLEIF
jgi:hypothetical protein